MYWIGSERKTSPVTVFPLLTSISQSGELLFLTPKARLWYFVFVLNKCRLTIILLLEKIYCVDYRIDYIYQLLPLYWASCEVVINFIFSFSVPKWSYIFSIEICAALFCTVVVNKQFKLIRVSYSCLMYKRFLYAICSEIKFMIMTAR